MKVGDGILDQIWKYLEMRWVVERLVWKRRKREEEPPKGIYSDPVPV